MDSSQFADTSISAIVPSSLASSGAEQELSRRGLERSRKTILYGWIISMIGVVFYCFLMSHSNQQPDLSGVLIAITIILIGVGFWLAGCVRFLNEAASSTTDTV